MKNLLLLIVIATVAACNNPSSTTNTSEAEQAPTTILGGKDYAINSDSSTVFWKGSKPTGDIHVGTVQIKKGILKISDSNITGGQFTIDMNSILVTDEDMSERGKSKLKKHLTNDDFFETNNYPEATLEITSSTSDSLKANLEIKNITKSITIPYTLSQTNKKIMASSSFSIDRTLWGVTYKSGSFFKNLADRLIDDAIQFDIELVGIE
jgi:polyisoprenoid-binding protein YceI